MRTRLAGAVLVMALGFLIAIAGPSMNILFAVGMLTFVYMVHYEYPAVLDEPAVIGWVMQDTPAAKAGILSGDMITALDGVGADGMADAVGELHEALGVLISRAQAAGAVRAELTVTDLVALLKGLLATVRADPDPGLRERVFAVVRDGLRPR